MDPGFATKMPKYKQKPEKLRRLLDRLETYDDYQRFSLANDPDAWWLEMTGKNPSRMTPRLRAYYDRHPDLQIQRDLEDSQQEALAAAAAAAQDEDWSYLS